MANKQHIYSGAGDPVTLAVVPDGTCSHYLDTVSGDIWLYSVEWNRIYVGGSLGNVAFYGSIGAPSNPDHPALKWENYRLYIAAEGNWEEVSLEPALE